MPKLVALALVLAAVPTVARAQNSQDIDYAALHKAKAGAWAEYAATMKASAATKLKLRINLVEKSAKSMAIEMINDTPMGAINARLEYTADGDAWKLSGGKIKVGDQPPQPVPPEQVQQSAPITKDSEPGKLIGTESVTTPAGEFKCRHYHKTVQTRQGPAEVDMWMSDKVAPTGLVKQVIEKQGVEVVLQKVGSK